MQAAFFKYIVLDGISPVYLTVSGFHYILSINTFIEENLWIYHLFALILITLIVIFLIKLSSINKKKKFIDDLAKKEGPLGSKNILYTLIDTLPDFIYIKDLNSQFIIANKKLARTVGKEEGEELIGLSDHDVYPKKLADEFRKNEIEIMTTGNAVIDHLEKGLDEDKKEIWVSSTKIPFRDVSGNVIGLVGIGRNVTAWKKSEEELAKKTSALHEANSLLEERQEEILQQQEELRTQTEMVLEEKKQLRILVDSMPDRIYIKDRKSRFIIGNIHVAKVMGANHPEELIGKTDFDFYEKSLAEEYFQDEQRIMNDGKAIVNKEERGLNADGHQIVVSTTKVPVYDERGDVIGIVGIGRDITLQKAAEKKLMEKSENLQEANVLLEERQEEIQQQSEELQTQAEHQISINKELEKLSIVASKTDNVIVIMDKDGNFEWVNAGFERRYGMKLEEFIRKKGRNLRQTSSSDDINTVLDEVIRLKKPAIYEARAVDNDNQQIWSQTTISPVLDDKGELVHIIAIDSNITKIKHAEEKINEQKKEIEKNRDELKILNASKDKFFSIIAHDLKNPFHSIMGFSDLLTRNYDSIEDEKRLEFIKLIKDSSTSAYSLLENLLNWARTQTNRINFNPTEINLTDIIGENFQMLSVNAQNKKIRLVPPVIKNPIAFADYNMVDTIIRNLLSNAIKFTPSGGEISLSVIENVERLTIKVKDSGIGMSPEDQKKMFKLDEFHSTPGTSGESGTGLGLIVCHEFIKKHGGELRVESSLNKGSTFIFDLPKSK